MTAATDTDLVLGFKIEGGLPIDLLKLLSDAITAAFPTATVDTLPDCVMAVRIKGDEYDAWCNDEDGDG